MSTTIGIGNRIGRRSGGDWSPKLLSQWTERDGLDLLETGSGDDLNAKILPSCGLNDSTNYIYHAINNFRNTDSSGYIEVRFYNSGATGIRDLFSTAAEAATARYFRMYMSGSLLYLDIRQNITTVFQNRFYVTTALSVGWHTVRIISSGGAYSAVVDGGATLTMGAGLTQPNGSNDGRWLDLVTLRNNICIGAYKSSAALATSTSFQYIDYVDYNNVHKWILTGQGNKVFDIIGDLHLTWGVPTTDPVTVPAHQHFDINGSQLLLDSGFSIWKKHGVPDEYVPYKAAAPMDVSAYLVGYEKVSDHAGSATKHNLAPSLIDFDYTEATPAKLIILDRSDTSFQTAVSRASEYYDSTKPYRYHPSELALPMVYMSYFNDGYRGMFYPQIETTETGSNYYPTALTGFYLSATDGKKRGQYNFMVTSGTGVFAATPVVYDTDGYVLTLLTDIKHFGAAATTATLEISQAIQKAVDYYYNDELTFGLASETYILGQTINLVSNKKYTVDSTIKLKAGSSSFLTQDYTAGEDLIHVESTEGFNVGDWVAVTTPELGLPIYLERGWSTQIVSIDREAKTIHFDSAIGAGCIYNSLVSDDARVGHTMNNFLAVGCTNIHFTGTGLIDGNYPEQAMINACLTDTIPFEEHKASSVITFYNSSNITIDGGLHFKRGVRHCVNINGFDTSNRCVGIIIQNIKCTEGYNKNCNIRYCTDVLIEDYEGTDAVMEDGLMFYMGNINCVVNRITVERNQRFGLAWNSAHGEGLVATDITTVDNFQAGVQVSCKDAVLNNLTMNDRLYLNNQYNNADNIEINGVTITGFIANEAHLGGVFVLRGNVRNSNINDLVIDGCTGKGVVASKEFTPDAPPEDIIVSGGGIYNHTGDLSDLAEGHDIIFTNFDNLPNTGTIPVVTTGAQTVTFARLDIIDDAELTIDWGDGSSNVYTDANNGATKTHAYAGAGTWEVTVTDARVLKEVNLNDALIVGFNSSFYLACGDNLESITHETALVTPTINSANMAHLKLSSTLYLLFTQAGTYTIDSDHFKAYPLSFQLILFFTQAGTYTIDSDHFKAYTLSSMLNLHFAQAGTYNIARADITFVSVPSVTINIPSLATSTDLILLGFYDIFPSKTNNGGTINLTGCPAPTGVYEANADCGTDPNGGKGAAHELLNDGCGRATDAAKKWASITVEGGLS